MQLLSIREDRAVSLDVLQGRNFMVSTIPPFSLSSLDGHSLIIKGNAKAVQMEGWDQTAQVNQPNKKKNEALNSHLQNCLTKISTCGSRHIDLVKLRENLYIRPSDNFTNL